MSIAVFATLQLEQCAAQAAKWREEARQDRIRADGALARGDRDGANRWLAQARLCEAWAAESQEAADQFAAINARLGDA
jgi:hypothetical protein